MFLKKEAFALYLGAAIQRQDKTTSTQDDLYSENLTMAVIGGRYRIWNNLTFFAELRTIERSRGGFYTGNMWRYRVSEQLVFSEFYGEIIALPSFHTYPISTFWFKQGLRFSLTTQIFLDPYLEVYLRRSPTPDLGRDTNQARFGARAVYSRGSWTTGLLIYQSYPSGDEPNHAEGLFFVAGGF